MVQTNNATFDEAEARQQLAMVRLRAVEHGRAALMASTVGVSAFVDRDGRVSGATGFNTRAVVVRQLRLGDGTYPRHPARPVAGGGAGCCWPCRRWSGAALLRRRPRQADGGRRQRRRETEER